MNKWGKFAEMLGLELEQEFVLTDADGNITEGEISLHLSSVVNKDLHPCLLLSS